MKPGDHISVVTNVGNLTGTLNGWDANGVKIAVYDCYTTWIKWTNIYGIQIT